MKLRRCRAADSKLGRWEGILTSGKVPLEKTLDDDGNQLSEGLRQALDLKRR